MELITAKHASERTHARIKSVMERVNDSIEAAIDKGEYTCIVYLTENEGLIMANHLDSDFLCTKGERSGSMSHCYSIEWPDPTEVED